jgi:carboxyl-terminal processing protease
VIIDFRYHGGGLVDVAEEMGDLLGDDRPTTDVLSFTTYRPEKAQFNETRRFQRRPEAIAAARIAFIGTRASASASEAVMNGSIPYLGAAAGLVGANTFGKPVGQIGLDRAQCDDRLRVVAFSVQNANRQANYFNGMASEFAATCQAGDDISRQMGDPEEASTRAALDFLAGRPCAPISLEARGASAREGQRQLLMPERPDVAQREVPGLF